MKLADWLHERSTAPGQLRFLLGVTHRSTVWRWLTGERTPQPEMIEKIKHLTGGLVTERDFDDPSPPRCSLIEIVGNGVTLTHLPWSPDYERIKRAMEEEDDDPAGPGGTPPIRKALNVLGSRGQFTPRGRVLLDGRVTDLRRLVAAANDVLRSRREPPIPYPGVEPLP